MNVLKIKWDDNRIRKQWRKYFNEMFSDDSEEQEENN